MPSVPALSRALAESQPIVALCGDGLLVECGLEPGPWQGYRVDDLLTPAAFARDPELVWQYYNWRRERAATLAPGPGHEALARAGGRSKAFHLFSLAIDGFHHRAGSPRVEEVFGSIWSVRCIACQRTVRDERVPFPSASTCEACGGVVRPDVVWYGEPLEPEGIERARRAAELSKVFLVAGTAGQNHPAAMLMLAARRSGATVIEVNPEATPLSSHAHHAIHGEIGGVLRELLA